MITVNPYAVLAWMGACFFSGAALALGAVNLHHFRKTHRSDDKDVARG